MNTHEKNLSANQTPPQAKIRFSRSHENDIGAQGDSSSPPLRTEGPIEITLKRKAFGFSKKERLLTRQDFKRISREGKRLVGVCLCIDCLKSPRARLGITASGRYGNSPERNRFKRLVREVFRLHKTMFPRGYEINVIPRKLAKTATLAEIKEDLLNCLKRF